MDLQFGHGHAARKLTCIMDLDMLHPWTFSMELDVDMQHRQEHAECPSSFPCCIIMSQHSCMSMSLLHAQVYAAYPCPYCMSMSMLHVHVFFFSLIRLFNFYSIYHIIRNKEHIRHILQDISQQYSMSISTNSVATVRCITRSIYHYVE